MVLLFSLVQDKGRGMFVMSLMETHYKSSTPGSRQDAMGGLRRGKEKKIGVGRQREKREESRNCLIIIPWTRVSPPDRIAQMRFSGSGAWRQTRLPKTKGRWRAVVPVQGGFGCCRSARRLCVEPSVARVLRCCC